MNHRIRKTATPAALLLALPFFFAGALQAQSTESDMDRTEMSESRRFLLLHGAFHVGDAWNGVIAELVKAGHAGEAITFPGHGKEVDRGGVEFSDYEDSLISALRRQDEPVIVVGHSAAGVVMQSAVPKAADKVAATVFHNAFILEDGRSMIESIPPEIAQQFRADAEASADNSLPVSEYFFRNVLMKGASEAVIDRVLAQVVPQPFNYYTHRIHTGPFLELDTPRYILLATDDASLPKEAWLGMATLLGDHKVIRISGGHEVLYTNPAEVAKGLAEIAEDLRAR